MGSEGTQETWLITGCSSGLGRALSEAALERGHRVVATARDVRTLADLVAKWPDRAFAYELDVVDPLQVQNVVSNATAETGGIDVLVNNAGRVLFGAVEEVSDADLRDLFDLHVFGPANLVRAVLPQMRERRSGTIVQMSSMGSFYISTGFSSYTATKAALEGLSATLAMEVAPFGINVIIVEPSGFRTSVFSPQQIGRAAEMPEYKEIVGPTLDFVTGLSGHQDGDPARASEVIIDVVALENPPLRLPLGGAAVDLITQAVDEINTNIRQWENVARSTAFDGAAVEMPRD